MESGSYVVVASSGKMARGAVLITDDDVVPLDT